jgi:hypothetical protein
MPKGMKQFCAGAVIGLLTLLTSGCETYHAVVNGEPDLSDKNLMIPNPADNETPPECLNVRDNDVGGIKKCTEVIRLMIDRRYNAYKHDLYALVTTGNALADATISGLGVAGTLTAPGTTKVLSAIIAGLNGLKTTASEDLLYKNSIVLILIQMEKDRASEATIIQKHLDNNSYMTMNEALIDLYAYFVAGTFDDAIIKMQTDSGAQAAACAAELKNAKLNITSDSSTGATATAPCPATSPPSGATQTPSPVTINFKSGQKVLDAAGIQAVDDAAARFLAGKKAGTLSLLTVKGTATPTKNTDNSSYAAARAVAVVTELKNKGVSAADIKSPPETAVDGTLRAIITFSQETPVAAAAPAPAPSPVPAVGDIKVGAVFEMDDNRTIRIEALSGGVATYVVLLNGTTWDKANPASENAVSLQHRLVKMDAPGG